MKRLEQLEAMVNETGDPKLTQFIKAVKMYVKNLNSMAERGPLRHFTIMKIDLPSFEIQLKDSGLINNIAKSSVKIEIFISEILYVTRHIWAMSDINGDCRDGNDLHNLDPKSFEDEEMMSVEETFAHLPYLQSITEAYC